MFFLYDEPPTLDLLVSGFYRGPRRASRALASVSVAAETALSAFVNSQTKGDVSGKLAV
jgi:hypothetical protein